MLVHVFDAPVVQVAIGLAFLYFLFSLIVSGVNEAVASWLGLRAKQLKAAISNMLDSSDSDSLADRFYDDSIVQSLGLHRAGRFRLPSYIPSSDFASALFNTLTTADPTGAVTEHLDQLPEPLRGRLKSMAEEVGDNVVAFRAAVESWFDNTMDRVSGWYRRKARLRLAILALIVAGAGNLDTLAIADTIWKDDVAREALVSAAGDVQETDDLDQVAEQVESTQAFGVPIGWSANPDDPRHAGEGPTDYLFKSFGLLITAAALTLGAPFWFDLLNRIASLRASGRKPDPSAGALPAARGGAHQDGRAAKLLDMAGAG